MKEKTKISTIVASVSGDRFAVAEWNKNIQIWSFEHGFIRTIETDLVCGMAEAISISEDGKELCVAGNDHRSISLYTIDTGELIWKRTDLSKPYMAFIIENTSESIVVATERKGAFLLHRKTGETLERLKGVKSVRMSPYSEHIKFERGTGFSVFKWKDRLKLKNNINHKGALLGSCFSVKGIFFTYSAGPLAAFCINSFKPLWVIEVKGHFLEIEYMLDLNKLVGIRYEYGESSIIYLSYIDVETGKIEKEIILGEEIEVGFIKNGAYALTTKGDLFSIEKQLVVKTFDFENH